MALRAAADGSGIDERRGEVARVVSRAALAVEERARMGNMEEQNFDLLNIDQEDDNLLGISPANAELLLGVSPLSPSMMPKALKQASVEDLENCYGEFAGVGESLVTWLRENVRLYGEIVSSTSSC